MKFFRGLLFAIPVSLALWGMIFIAFARSATASVLSIAPPGCF